MKPRREETTDYTKILYQEAKREYKKRHYYRILVLRSVAAFFIGLILSVLFKALSLGAFLIALALCGFVALFVFTL